MNRPTNRPARTTTPKPWSFLKRLLWTPRPGKGGRPAGARPALEPLGDRVVPATLDLTTAGAAGVANGALFQQVRPQPTGTGVIDSFVRVQSAANGKSPFEQGYNSDYRKVQFDENTSPQFTRSLTLGSVPVVVVNGKAYREFLLDINQSASAPLLSLDEARVYVGGAGNLTGYNPTTKQLAGLNPVYDMDGAGEVFVKLNAGLTTGSGSGDMVMLVPDAAFANAPAGSFVYLYSKFGAQAGSMAANGGFEEWAVKRAPTGSISGKVFLDVNQNGAQDTGDASLAGVSLSLIQNGLVAKTTTTDANGRYSFGGLATGSYTVRETQPAAYDDGKDYAGTAGGTANAAGAADDISGITVTDGQAAANYNFTEKVPTGKISGTVFVDNDQKGTLDGTDRPLPGVLVTLARPDGTTATATTGADGSYSFTGLVAGKYTVTEGATAGYVDGLDYAGTTPVPGSNTADAVPLTLAAGGVSTATFTETGATISGTVFLDVKQNKTLDDADGDALLPGVAVTLTGPNGTTTTTTDENGFYSFTGLAAGAYQVVEDQSTVRGVTVVDGKDYDTTGLVVSPDTDTVPVSLGAGGAATATFTEAPPPATISGTVFVDNGELTANGTIGDGDVALGGVTVNLYKDGVAGVYATTTTGTAGGALGTYSFSNLPAGTYTVVEVQPAAAGIIDGKDYLRGGEVAGSVGTDKVGPVVLAAGGSADVTFTETPPATISGRVFVDNNQDGILNGADKLLPGVPVTLTGPNGTTKVATDADGSYSFSNLPAGTYTLAEGATPGYADGLDYDGQQNADGTDRPVAGSAGTDALTVALGAGASVTTAFTETGATISGAVWVDVNQDRIANDPRDARLDGVKVTLTGTTLSGRAVSLETTTQVDPATGAHGTYAFPGLEAGTYTVTEIQSTVGVAVIDGLDYLDGGAVAGSARTDVVTVASLAAGGSADVTFTETLPSTISGTVFLDSGAPTTTGTPGAGDVGLVGVPLRLLDAGGNPVLKADGVTPVTTTTDKDGAYSFEGLAAGNYIVREVGLAAWGDSTDFLDGAAVSNAGAATFDDVPVDLKAGTVANAVFTDVPGSISGTVYLDVNQNGTNDGPLSGVKVTLYKVDVDPVTSKTRFTTVGVPVTTGTNGAYSFTGLEAGEYVVGEDQPDGYLDGLDFGTGGLVSGSDQNLDSVPVSLAGGAKVTTAFTETLPSTISGTVFVDNNQDGVLNGADTFLPGVLVTLTGPNGTTTATTDANGAYTFTGLAKGTYTVTEAQPDGYDDGKDYLNGDESGAAGATDSVTVTNLLAGQAAKVTFTETPPVVVATGKITGTVFVDNNQDGVLNGPDKALPGVSVTLTGPNGTTTAQTDANGTYTFSNLPAGTYTLTEETTPLYVDGLDYGTDGKAIVGSSGTDAIALTLGSGASVTTAFTETGATIAGRVVVQLTKLDPDGKVVVDGGGDPVSDDTPVEDVVVTLYRAGTTDPVGSTKTNPDGTYTFLGLPAGNYTVIESGPAAWGDSFDFLNGDLVANGGVSYDEVPVQLGAGATAQVVFTEAPATVVGQVTAERGDSLPNGLGGIKVRLAGTDIDGAAVERFAYTDADGNYTFFNLPAAADGDVYTITLPDYAGAGVADTGLSAGQFAVVSTLEIPA